MWSLFSSHALTIWMPVCAAHMSVGLSFCPLPTSCVSISPTPEQSDFFLYYFTLIYVLLQHVVSLKHTNNAHVIKVDYYSDGQFFCVSLYIFGCIFMYINIFVLITVVCQNKIEHFQDKAVNYWKGYGFSTKSLTNSTVSSSSSSTSSGITHSTYK